MTSDDLAARGAPELLPCPFCGAEPEYSPPSELSDLPFIACPAVVRTPEGFEEECGLTSQSVTHWNRRAALIRDAEARGIERAAKIAAEAAVDAKDDPGTGWASHSWLMTVCRILEAEAAALRGEKEPK